LEKIGGWPETVGEDIVLTWGIHRQGYRVGYAENALVFTNVPETYKQFYHQRKRWARGLIEAFKKYPDVIWKWKANTPFIMLNLTFPILDFVYLFVFIPGIIAAVVFNNYLIVGIMTLFLLPLALLGNWIMFIKQRAIFKDMGLVVRKNVLGFITYMLFYQLIMAPASLGGYFAEFLNLRKTWGTK
jgi:biofilm PGA synthesis N-glycosyltransferase PgaC